MVDAAKLAEVFQWMTPDESCEAHLDAVSKQRISEKIADVLLCLLQVADLRAKFRTLFGHSALKKQQG